MARILLVEGNARQRELHATLLYYNGFDVDQAATAEAVPAILKQHRPDLIMIDYVLPGVDGLSATKLLKESPDTAAIPIICFSAHDIPASAIRNAHADGYMRKPLHGDQLVQSIRTLIGGKQTRAGMPEATRRAVIIADKESDVAESLATALRMEGFKISRAGDGATGLGTVAVVKPELVVIDIHSPVLDGWSLIRRMRSDSSICHVPAFAFSETPSAEEAKRAVDAGFAAYLQQIDRESIADEVKRHVTTTAPK